MRPSFTLKPFNVSRRPVRHVGVERAGVSTLVAVYRSEMQRFPLAHWRIINEPIMEFDIPGGILRRRINSNHPCAHVRRGKGAGYSFREMISNCEEVRILIFFSYFF